MALALASSGLTSMIPMKTGGWWFSPSRLRDVHRLNELLEKLRDKGNTVIVVEHDPDVIKVADYVVDMGPYAGSEGGQVVYEGSFAGLLKADTLTGNHLQSKRPLKDAFRQATGTLPIVHATVNNLKDVSVTIPTGVLTVITGVAGSGKSSLITEAFLSQHQEAVVIDQAFADEPVFGIDAG